MAMTAPQIARSLMMCLLGLLLSGSTALLAQSIDGTTFLPVQEQLPLGTEMVSVVDGQAEMDEGFMPGLVEFARVGAALLGVVMLLLAMRYMLRRMGGVLGQTAIRGGPDTCSLSGVAGTADRDPAGGQSVHRGPSGRWRHADPLRDHRFR